MTHVLNTAEQHVTVSQARYAAHGIQYLGFHVDDLPHCNISRFAQISHQHQCKVKTHSLHHFNQIFSPDDGVYPPGGDRGRAGGCELLHGAEQVRQRCDCLPDDQTRHVARAGESESAVTRKRVVILFIFQALGFVKKSRNVRPNEGFVRQLKDLELSLKRRR